jgi:hypothetical protein
MSYRSEEYLRERGIHPTTAEENKVELNVNVEAATYRRRLKMDQWPGGMGPLHEVVEESIWFPCADGNTTVHSWIVRPFSHLNSSNGTSAKFLATKDGGGYPYIPKATWDVASKPHCPILITEGPVKALAALQAGAYPIAVNGVWMAACADGETGATSLHPAIRDGFALVGRTVYLAFDADFATNPRVLQALIRTAILLIKAGAEVKVLTWPIARGKGLDDYLVSDDPVQSLKVLCDAAGNLSKVIRPCHLDLVRTEIVRARIVDSKLSQICKMVARSLGIRGSALEADCEELMRRHQASDAPAIEIEAYYDSLRKEYLIKNTSDRWLSLSEAQFKMRLRNLGVSEYIPDDQMISPSEEVLLEIQNKHDVQFVGALSGRDSGFYIENGIRMLVTSSPIMIEPMEGEFPKLHQIFESMLGGATETWGKQQTTTFYGWLQCAYRALKARRQLPGQALAFAGPVDSGKSLVQCLITYILGGRAAKAAPFLQGKTNFNSELFGAEHLMLEDEHASTSHDARKALAAHIKGIAVNQLHPCHGKQRDIINIPPWWRVTISLNDQPDRLLVLPILSDDISDKISILQATRVEMPMPTGTVKLRHKFFQTLVDELPAFIWWLDNEFVIPDEYKSSRYGIREFHHPGLVAALNELSPASALLDMIDRLQPWGLTNSEWEGKSSDLRQMLYQNPITQRDAIRLLEWINSCGQYLGDLAKSHPERVIDARTATKRTWKILKPAENTP